MWTSAWISYRERRLGHPDWRNTCYMLVSPHFIFDLFPLYSTRWVGTHPSSSPRLLTAKWWPGRLELAPRASVPKPTKQPSRHPSPVVTRLTEETCPQLFQSTSSLCSRMTTRSPKPHPWERGSL